MREDVAEVERTTWLKASLSLSQDLKAFFGLLALVGFALPLVLQELALKGGGGWKTRNFFSTSIVESVTGGFFLGFGTSLLLDDDSSLRLWLSLIL